MVPASEIVNVGNRRGGQGPAFAAAPATLASLMSLLLTLSWVHRYEGWASLLYGELAGTLARPARSRASESQIRGWVRGTNTDESQTT